MTKNINVGGDDLVPHTCPKCGKEFHAIKSIKVCPRCRGGNKPRAYDRKKAGAALTPRELLVADMVAEALTNKEIAFRMHLSTGSVKIYVGHILAKTRCANRTELAVSRLKQRAQAALHRTNELIAFLENQPPAA